jgi:hypothetical protein
MARALPSKREVLVSRETNKVIALLKKRENHSIEGEGSP